jgi:hypothetical protein
MHPLLLATLKFQETNIKTWLDEMDEIFSQLQVYADVPDGSINKQTIQIKKRRFEYLSERVFNLCIAYLELKGLPIYISKFEEKIKPFLLDKDKLYKSYSHFVDDEESLVTTLYRQFLNSFPAFGSVDEPKGKEYLLNILKHTAVILNEKQVEPSNETSIYNAVKVHCQAIFPDGSFSPAPFNKTAKEYKPDILVPSLNCAIEYKYAKSEKDLVRTIDEILIDVEGYSGHEVFTEFFAVFYVEPGILVEERFKQIWKEKKFPSNWQGILVQGY